MNAYNRQNEHLGSEQMLDLIEGTIKDAETKARTIEHLADCDRCLAEFADWLRVVKPREMLRSGKPCLKIGMRLTNS